MSKRICNILKEIKKMLFLYKIKNKTIISHRKDVVVRTIRYEGIKDRMINILLYTTYNCLQHYIYWNFVEESSLINSQTSGWQGWIVFFLSSKDQLLSKYILYSQQYLYIRINKCVIFHFLSKYQISYAMILQ